MNLTEIRKLVKLVESSQIQELEFEREGTRIRINKSDPSPQQVVAPAFPQMSQPEMIQQVQSYPASPGASPEKAIPEQAPQKQHHEIKSPMVGTFYAAPSPDADPYVKVGDKVKSGQVLCIVEAMKLMNEIEADASGTIVEVLSDNGRPVEYGQTLFLIDTNG